MDLGIFACTATFTVFSYVSVILAYIVNDVVIRPYMDEIFHIPQVQRYCQGDFTYWDSKITTPPGLYLITVGLLKPLIRYFPNLFNCDVVDVRSINLAFTFGNFYLCCAILNALNKDTKFPRFWHNAVTTLTISAFPPLYFFAFLYYTDAGSTFTVLLMYTLALHKYHFFASIIGAFAVLFRQTNIIWVAFCGMLAMIDIFERYASKALKKVDKSSWKYGKMGLHEGILLVLGRSQRSFHFLCDLVTSCAGYIFVGIGFLVFILWNQGIVLGDHTAHKATIHIPQVLYFSAFTFLFSFPNLVIDGQWKRLLILARKSLLLTIVSGLLFALIISTNSRAHPYLLSDNRHYTFYVWRRILDNFYSKFLVLPLYVYAIAAILAFLRRCRGILWTAAYCLCLIAALIPQELLEFRYFILPYLILRLNMPPARQTFCIALEFLSTFFINFITLYCFIMHPFLWPHEDTLQRFMW